MGTWSLDDELGYGMGWVGTLMMLIFWVVVIVAIVFLIRWLAASSKSKARGSAPEEPALEILKKRYARGEINKVEFEEKKRDLA